MTTSTRRRAMALILVLAAIALATVLSYAVLVGSTLQAAVGANSSQFAAAQCLAESGINAAMYYLQYPCTVPLLEDGSSYWKNGDKFWRGGTLSFGSSVPGNVDVTVSRLNTPDGRTYDISATGHTSVTLGPVVSSTIEAQVQVNALQLVPASLNVRGVFTLARAVTMAPSTSTPIVAASIYAPTTLGISSVGGTIGAIYASTTPTGTIPLGTKVSAPSATMVMPGNVNAADTVNHYLTYELDGVVCQAQKVPATDLHDVTIPSATVPADPTNPAHVFWSDQPTKIGKNLTLNGTLVVIGNRLQVYGANNVITPLNNFPAFVVDKDLQFTVVSSPCSLTATGACWLGLGVSGTGNLTGSKLSVAGALMFGSGATIPVTYTNIIGVTCDPTLTVRSLAPIQSAIDIKVLSWNSRRSL